jgi:carbon-monoxide dehydrogenase large subunit
MISGDSTLSTYGGGAWASRGIICGGEATLKACRALVTNILSIAAAVSQTTPDHLVVEKGAVINRDSGAQVLTLAEVARIGYFRQDTLPPDIDAQLSVTRSHVVNGLAYYVTSGVQASLVEVDIETGMIKLLKHWAVADCGRRINPLLVDEQLRGGIVQGIGSVLYEECIYDEQGTLANGTMAEYLAPMAFEMPDMELASVETIEKSTELGAKGVGESALIGAMGAVWVAVNDALKPLQAVMTHQPFTPERVLDAIALGRVQNNGRKL